MVFLHKKTLIYLFKNILIVIYSSLKNPESVNVQIFVISQV